MGKYQKFEELPVWQEAARLYHRVLDLVEESNLPFSPSFRGQFERAALSICNQSAASFDRMSTPDLLGYLRSARAAAAEVQSMAMVAAQRPKLARATDALQQIRGLGESCARQLGGWIAVVENPNGRPKPAANPERPGPAQRGMS